MLKNIFFKVKFLIFTVDDIIVLTSLPLFVSIVLVFIGEYHSLNYFEDLNRKKIKVLSLPDYRVCYKVLLFYCVLYIY